MASSNTSSQPLWCSTGYMNPNAFMWPGTMPYDAPPAESWPSTVCESMSASRSTTLDERVSAIEMANKRMFEELKNDIKQLTHEICRLAENVDKSRDRENRLIPVLCTLFIERLEKLVASGQQATEEEENLRSLVDQWSPGIEQDHCSQSDSESRS